MEDFVAYLWAAAPIVGAGVLAIGMVYGIYHSRRRRRPDHPPR